MGQGGEEIPLPDIIQIEDQYYILATSAVADERILKHGETFAVFDRRGNIQPVGPSAQGLYHEGTRFLSNLKFSLGKYQPMILSSTVKEDNALLTVDLTNPDLYNDGRVVAPQDTLHIFRAIFLLQGVCYGQTRIVNFGLYPVGVDLLFQYSADFADIFEVRGMKRKRKGRYLDGVMENGRVVLSYEGLDGVVRKTRLEFSPAPREITPSEAHFHIDLPPKKDATFFLTVSCESSEAVVSPLSYRKAYVQAASELKEAKAQDCEIYTSNEQFNDWLNRSVSDLHTMITQTPEGPYPYAGVPWFSAAFGRDGIITALEYLWVNPEIARGVLGYLASTGAREVNSEQEAAPGKILHETRKGEMAALKEIPFQRYYGSVDATPLFVVLAGAYFERTGDRDLIESIWPSVKLALKWMDTYGDPDHDGFVEYQRQSPQGLIHQGWKDSHDSVFHSDGTLAEGPIALCEVQGYVYEAKRRAAELASALEETEMSHELLEQAYALKQRFEEAFWCDEISSYALALDGQKRPCAVRTSNPGHCLFTGIASPEHARQVAESLLKSSMFSGWGIRTLATTEARYNPMSYHNGSIWPHDNALIAQGLALYGFKDLTVKILTGLFDASIFMDIHRLPELFCGFIRRRGEGPTLYPVACSPQSWASASVFLLLQACLGMTIKGSEGVVRFSFPTLPPFLKEIQIKNLRVGAGSVDLFLERHEGDVGINILRKDDNIKVIVEK